ncbi:STAS domain-containing protein [Paenibacillus frigoriresistens]|uniref:STAS domain-containing protein n=1 Tax=Paenibacillus alginolyticus TaxID=59839 RepID=UPI0015662825|nr:STAS domain-containing protein [Paenibacillus frigoriresistens]NRF95574.1 STAS domain-containing protein [Paenibacillus frigoriresistens]
MFTYSINQMDSKSIVSFEGDMDIDVTEILEDELPSSLYVCKEIILNFGKVSFVDSSGIGLLISLIQDLRERGIRVVISHLKPDVKEVFFLLQLPEILGYNVFEVDEV